MSASITKDQVYHLLQSVTDPEVPVLTILDLGIVRNVELIEKEGQTSVKVTITPTYSGCPAMDVISINIRMALRRISRTWKPPSPHRVRSGHSERLTYRFKSNFKSVSVWHSQTFVVAHRWNGTQRDLFLQNRQTNTIPQIWVSCKLNMIYSTGSFGLRRPALPTASSTEEVDSEQEGSSDDERPNQ